MRKSICLLLSFLLTAALALPAFASEETPSDPLPISEEGSSPVEPTPTACPHSADSGTVTTAATCSSAGTMTYNCTSCGAVTRTETIPATGVHTYGGWQNVGDIHKRVCTGGCGTEETASHSWDGGTVTTAATCASTGLRTYSCSCGATKTETIAIDSSAHSYGEWDGNEGSHSRTCGLCGHTESGSHSWYSSTITMAPTCQEEGIEALVCTTCGGILYEVLPVVAHSYDNVCDPDCNMCGLTRETAHKFSAVWSKNSTQHWHACTLCGEKTDIGSHFPGPAATEEKAQLCLTCGLTMTPQLNHTHKYETEWTSDEVGHWYACSGCDDQKDLEEHDYDGPCDPDCNTCGYTTANAHSYDGNWNSDESGHWAVCTVCGEGEELKEHVPGPEATETEAQLCSVCGFELAPALEHVHDTEGDWLTDEENHWKECQCGEETEKAPHIWDEGTEADGILTYRCTECEAERTEEVPQTSQFPFGIVLTVLLVLLAGAVTALVLVLRKPKSE